MLPFILLFSTTRTLSTALAVASQQTQSNGMSQRSNYCHIDRPPSGMSLHDPYVGTDTLISVVEHVFLPPKLPQEAPTEEAERQTNVALCHILIQAARAFLDDLPALRQPLWSQMITMMVSIYQAAKVPRVEVELVRVLSNLVIGGALEFTSAVLSSLTLTVRCLRNARSSSECRRCRSHSHRSSPIRDI